MQQIREECWKLRETHEKLLRSEVYDQLQRELDSYFSKCMTERVQEKKKELFSKLRKETEGNTGFDALLDELESFV